MPTLSQGHPCPQLFPKRHQTSIGKDVSKDLLEKEREKEEKRKRREEEKKSIKNTSFYEERN
jgi:hypothetical protein